MESAALLRKPQKGGCRYAVNQWNDFRREFHLAPRDIVVQGERIAALPPWEKETQGDTVDLSDKLVLPGFIDQHIHGCGGFDVEDGTLEAIRAMSQELARHGVTSFCPTVMSGPLDKLPGIIERCAGVKNRGFWERILTACVWRGLICRRQRKGPKRKTICESPVWTSF